MEPRNPLGARSLNHLAIGLAGFWDTPSVPGLYRKMCPTLRLDSGTRFPFEAPMGKRVPFRELIPGCSFR